MTIADFSGQGTRFNLTILPCVPDLSCNNKLDTIGRSVCLLIIDGNHYCTGTLINNTAKRWKTVYAHGFTLP